MSIAVGIGLHNFSEGLAICQAAKAGELSLAVLLIIGLALHSRRPARPHHRPRPRPR